MNTMRETRNPDKHSLFIIDEVDQFIGTVLSNIRNDTGRARRIYDSIQLEMQKDINTRIITMSATPITQEPFELGLLFNLLSPQLFPTKMSEFNEMFVKDDTLSADSRNLFMRRILSKVSYFRGQTVDKFATQKTFYVHCTLDGYGLKVYKSFENKEEEREQRLKTKGRTGRTSMFQLHTGDSKNTEGDTFRIYTRQAANFIIPNINEDINGINRPRRDIFGITDPVEKSKANKKYENIRQNILSEMIKYWKKLNSEDEKTGHTLKKSLDKFKKSNEKDFAEKTESYNFDEIFSFLETDAKQCKLLRSLLTSSQKMTRIMFLISVSPGNVLIYSSFVEMEGIEILSIYLDIFGFSKFTLKGKKTTTDDFNRFADFNSSSKVNEETRAIFNHPKNSRGKDIRVIIISRKSTAGISLKNVRQVHILEPFWQERLIEQAIGRAIRDCSHKDLPIEERHVEIFRHIIKQPSGKKTADELLHQLSMKKEAIISEFKKAMRESAVDCALNKNQNWEKNKPGHCFTFDISSQFSNVSPAFTQNLQNDIYTDRGMYADKTERQKVYKIMGSFQIGTSKYLKAQPFWYDPKHMLAFDYELHFIVGKVTKTEDGLPKRLEDGTFIISERVNVPMITND
tara:strand:- start:414 stop:2297 length:1884 start_codon:yes stop_codon:yes gene_type:complete